MLQTAWTSSQRIRRAAPEPRRGARPDGRRHAGRKQPARRRPGRAGAPPRSTPPSRPSSCARSTQALLHRSRTASTSTRSWSGRLQRRRAAFGPAGAGDRLGPRRGAGLRLASWRTASPIRLTGQDAERGTFSQRHAVLHDAETGARYVAAPGAAGGARLVRGPQQPALRERRARLRVRLQRAGAGRAGALGSPVRRLRQRRAGDHRPVHRRRRAPSGASHRRWCCCCRTATRARGRSTPARGWSASCSSPPRTTSASRTAPPPRSTSTCCAARRCCCDWTRARWCDDAQEPAAPPAAPAPGARPSRSERLASSRARRPELAAADRAAARSTATWSLHVQRRRVDPVRSRPRDGEHAGPADGQRRRLSRSRGSRSCTRSRPASCGALLASYPNLRGVVWLQEEPRNMGAWSYIAPRLRELSTRPAAARLRRPPRSASPPRAR